MQETLTVEKSKKEEKLKERFNVRWRTIKKKTKKIDRLSLPNKEKLWEKILKKYRNDFRCYYCGQKLKIKDSKFPYFKSFSIDHKISIDLGGTNDINNLVVCCHRCNIVKSTMKAETFKRMLNCSSPLVEKKSLLDQIFYELFQGRLPNKLDREDKR